MSNKFKPGNHQTYTHHVDLNERGEYRMHVENQNGKIVFSASNTEDAEENSEFWLTRDGFMKHTSDMAGLEEYLKEMGIMPKNSTLIDKK